MPRSDRMRYALSDYTVELRDRGWYFGRQFEATGHYRGPYSSVASLTLTIARHLRREIERRHRPVVVNASVEVIDASRS